MHNNSCQSPWWWYKVNTWTTLWKVSQLISRCMYFLWYPYMKAPWSIFITDLGPLVQVNPFQQNGLPYSYQYECFCLIWLFTSHQQSFSYVGTGLPGLNQHLARINVSCSRTQCGEAGEARARSPLVSSQAHYHWATVRSPNQYECQANFQF